jgi:hypothetical protein
MHTTLLWVVVFGLTAPAAMTEETVPFEEDYRLARKAAADVQKPLAVFLGTGEDGFKQVGKGGLTADIEKLLAAKYVCVYVDTSTPEGKNLARAFEMPTGLGIILSDRSGDVQAFRHEGDLAQDNLLSYLTRFANPTAPVLRTESNPDHPTLTPASYQSAPRFQNIYQPNTIPNYGNSGFAPSFMQPRYSPSNCVT